jgi:hypothetical protein
MEKCEMATDTKESIISIIQQNIKSDDGLKNVSEGLSNVASLLNSVNQTIISLRTSDTNRNVINKYLNIKQQLQNIESAIETYQSFGDGTKTASYGSLQKVNVKLQKAVMEVVKNSMSMINENNNKLSGDSEKLLNSLSKMFDLKVLNDIHNNYSQAGDSLVRLIDNTKKIRSALLNSAETINKTKIESNIINDQNIVNKTDSRILTSISQTMSHLYDNIAKSNTMLLQMTGDTPNIDALTIVGKIEEVKNNIKNNRQQGNISGYLENLKQVHELAQQTIMGFSKSTQDFDFEKFNEVFSRVDKIQKELTVVKPLINEVSDVLGQTYDFSLSEDSMADAIRHIHENYKKSAQQELTSLVSEFKNVDSNSQITTEMAGRELASMGFNHSATAMLNELNMSRRNSNSLFSDSFSDSVDNLDRVYSYASQAHDTVQNSVDMASGKHFSKSNILAQNSQLLINNQMRTNNAVIDVADNVSKLGLKHFSNKQDKKTASEVRKTIETAIDDTVKAINAQSLIDPDSKVVSALKEQLEKLENERDDLDEAINNKEVSFYKELFKDVSSVWGVIGKGLAMLGMGGLFSATSFLDIVKDRYKKNGQSLYNNYMSNYSIGANGASGARDLTYNMGNKYYAMTYGMVDFDEPSKMYRDLAKQVGGSYNSNPNANARDLNYFTHTLFAPANLYGISNGTMAEALNTWYKNNRSDAETATTTIYTVMADAQKAQVPVEKYMKQVSRLTDTLRNMGFGGNLAINMVSSMVDDGMRVEDAVNLTTNIATVQTNFSKNKTNAYYAVMAGQTGSMWAAMGSALMVADENGDPFKNRYKMMGERLNMKYNMLNSGLGVSDGISNFVMMQSMMGDGMTQKNASVLTSKLSNGDTEGAGKYLAGMDEEELHKSENVEKGLKGFEDSLAKAGKQLSEMQKIKATRVLEANKLAELINTKYKKQMDDLANKMKKIIDAMAKGITKIIKFLGELSKSPIVHSALLWAAHNPWKTLAMGAGAFGLGALALHGAKRGIKNWWNKKTNVSNKTVDEVEEVAEKAKSKTGGFFSGLKNKASKLFGKIPNIFKGKKGKLGLLALIGGATLANSGKSEAAELGAGESDETYVQTMADMFDSGTAKMQFVNKDGSPVDLHQDNKIRDYVASTGFSNYLYYGTLGLATVAVTRGFSKNKKVSEAIEKEVKELEKNNDKKRNRNLAKAHALMGEKMKYDKETKQLVKKQAELKARSQSIGMKVFNRIKGFLKDNRGTFAMTGLFSALNEFSNGETRPWYEHVARVGVDTAVEGGAYALASGAASRIPVVGKYVAPIAGMAASSFASKGGDKLKELLGIGNKVSAANMEFLKTLNADTDMYGHSMIDLIKSDTEQGRAIKQFLAENGIDYDSLNASEKRIFKQMMDDFTKAHVSLAVLLATAQQAFVEYKRRAALANRNRRGNKPYKNVQLNEQEKESVETKFNTIFNPDSPVEYYAGIEKAAQEHYNKVTNQLEEFDGEPDISDADNYNKYKQLKKEQHEMEQIASYARCKQGDLQPLNDELAGLTFGSGTDENAVAGKIMSNWSEVLTSGGENGSWEDILKRETRERLEEEAQQEAYQEDPSRGGSGDGSGGGSALALVQSQSPEAANELEYIANAHGISANAFAAIALSEHSGQILGLHDYDNDGGYDVGGYGFMQINPQWHPEVLNMNTSENINLGATMFRDLLDKYNGDYRLAIAAYNAGEGAVDNAVEAARENGSDIYEAADSVTTSHYLNRALGYMNGDVPTGYGPDNSSPSTTPTDNLMGDLPQDSEMVQYCKIVSAKTGVRADYILAQLISESGWGMLNQHKPGYNYGNAGDGGYATFNSLEEAANFMADHSIAYAKDRQALAAAANRGDAAAFVHILAQNGYFTTLESKYLATFESVLAQLKNRGVNLGAFGSGDLSGLLKNFKPKTLSEQAEDNAKRFANALQSMGVSSGKTGQGRIVDGMYVDIGSKFESIDEIRKRYEAMDAQKPKNETYISKYHESAQKATDDAAKRSLKQVEDATKANLKSQQDTMEMSMRELQKQKLEQMQKGERTAAMAITGQLKKGKSSEEMAAKIKAFLESIKCDVNLVNIKNV